MSNNNQFNKPTNYTPNKLNILPNKIPTTDTTLTTTNSAAH